MQKRFHQMTGANQWFWIHSYTKNETKNVIRMCCALSSGETSAKSLGNHHKVRLAAIHHSVIYEIWLMRVENIKKVSTFDNLYLRHNLRRDLKDEINCIWRHKIIHKISLLNYPHSKYRHITQLTLVRSYLCRQINLY